LIRNVSRHRRSANAEVTAATETIVKLIDDLDGTQAAETMMFGLDGRNYEIELSTKNAIKLRNFLTTYAHAGRRTSTTTRRPRKREHEQITSGADYNRAIREWADRAGIQVAPHGTCPFRA
jgi:Lsr2